MPPISLHGKSIIAGIAADSDAGIFYGVNPKSRAKLQPAFQEASIEVCHAAAYAVASAYELYRHKTSAQIAAFLESIGEELQNGSEHILQRAHDETALPLDRLNSELTRTLNQFKIFASLVREGSWIDARIDRPLPDRKPLPKPDLRRMLVPLGPVLVFSASNFPLAYSVAGGDTASALAAGNTVVVKAHPAHPGTSELVMHAIQKAIVRCEMPAGTVALIQSTRTEAGQALTTHPRIKAIGFTGSQGAGRAIYNAAAARPIPIPVYAEMGSVNPVFILPGALKGQAASLAEKLTQSATSGVGQFCTNPGVVLLLPCADTSEFIAEMVKRISATEPGTMLYQGICERFQAGIRVLRSIPRVKVLARSARAAKRAQTEASAILLKCDGATFLRVPYLREEFFGPSTLLVMCRNLAEMKEALNYFEGQITATLHGSAAELEQHRDFVERLSQKAGRVILNGFPTGVEVCASMVHGGPYPATTDSHTTSVGPASITRWVSPVCFQNAPESVLPPPLRNKNTGNIWRMIDGELTRADV